MDSRIGAHHGKTRDRYGVPAGFKDTHSGHVTLKRHGARWLLALAAAAILTACGSGGSSAADTAATNAEQEASGGVCEGVATTSAATSITVTLDPNGGSVTPTTLDVCSEGTYPSLPTPTRDGFAFQGWAHDGTRVTQGDSLLSANPHRLTASWTAETTSVTFHAGLGSFPDSNESSITAVRPVGANLEPEGFVRPVIDGGAFLYWRDATGNQVDAVGSDDLTVEAVYDITVTVTFDLQGGSWPNGEDPDELADQTGTQVVLNLGEVYDPSGTLSTPVRSGYAFDRWNLRHPDGSAYLDDILPSREPVIFRDDHAVVANWLPQHEIGFAANAPSGREANVTGVPTGPLTVTERRAYPALPQPSLPGYTFDGWHTEGLGGGVVDGTEIVGSDDPSGRESTFVPQWTDDMTPPLNTLHASWVARDVDVTFDENHPEGAATVLAATVDGTYTVPATPPQRTGYTFAAWNTAEDGSGSAIEAGDSVTPTDDHTLYAQWDANTYTVTYMSGAADVNFDGEDSDVLTKQVAFGEAYPSLASLGTGLSRPGFALDGWLIDGGEPLATLPTEMSVAKDHTVEAVWVKTDLTVGVCMVLSGCTEESDFDEYQAQVGSWYTGFTLEKITDPSGDRWHYGWRYYPTGSSGPPEDLTETDVTGDTVLLPADHRIEPLSNARRTITLDGNHPQPGFGTTVTLPSETYRVAQGEAYPSIADASLEGYTFQGWALSSESTDVIGAATQSTVDAPHTLYAVWLGNGIDVTFDRGYGLPEDRQTSTTQTYGDPYSPNEAGLTAVQRSGFTFTGWFLDDDGETPLTGPKVIGADDASVAGVLVDDAAPHTVYAGWTPNEYTVTFNLQGGSWPAGGDPDEVADVTGSQIVRLFTDAYNREGAVPDPERSGYVFQYWAVVADSGNYSLNDVLLSSPLQWAGDHELHAVWRKQHDVALNGNAPAGRSVTVTPNTVTVTEGLTVPALPVPEIAGYTFTGWYPSLASVGVEADRIDDENADNPDGVPTWEDGAAGTPWTTLYAGWTANEIVVTYDENHGAGGATTATVTVDGVYEHPDAPENRSNYTFTGWNTAADGSGTDIADAASVSATDAHTLYAQWTYSGQATAWSGGTAASPAAGSFTLDGVTYTVTSTTDGTAGNGADVQLVGALRTPGSPGTTLDATTPAEALVDGTTSMTYVRFGTVTPNDIKGAIEALTDAEGNPLYSVTISGDGSMALPDRTVTIDGGVTEFVIDPAGPNNAVLVRAFDHGSTTYQDAIVTISNKESPLSPAFQSQASSAGALEIELPSDTATSAQAFVDLVNNATQTPEHLDHWTAELTTDSDNAAGVTNDGSGVMPGAPYQHAHTVQSVSVRAGRSGFFGGTPYPRTFFDRNALHAFPTDDQATGVNPIDFDAPTVAYRVWPTMVDGAWNWTPGASGGISILVDTPDGLADVQRDLIGGTGTSPRSAKWLPLEDAAFEAMTVSEREAFVADTQNSGDRISHVGALMFAKLPQTAYGDFATAVKAEENVAGTNHAAFSSTNYPLQLLGDQAMILRQSPDATEGERFFFGSNVAYSSGTVYAYDLNYTPASYTVDPAGPDNAFVVVIDDASVDTTLPLRIEYAHKTAGNEIEAAFTPNDGGVNRLTLAFSRRGDSVDEIVPVIHDLAALDAYLADGSTGAGKIGFANLTRTSYTPSEGVLQMPTSDGLVDVTVQGTGTATVTPDGSLDGSDAQLIVQADASAHVLRYIQNSAIGSVVSALEDDAGWGTLSNVAVSIPSANTSAAVQADAEVTLLGGTDFSADQASIVLESGTLQASSATTVTGKQLSIEAGAAAAITSDANGITLTVVPGSTTVNDLKGLGSFGANLEALNLETGAGTDNDAVIINR